MRKDIDMAVAGRFDEGSFVGFGRPDSGPDRDGTQKSRKSDAA
jgi:hypothetical protein